ncbi:MAG: ABC transporter substrate-binding protein [Hydrogenophaga sp.]
MFAQTPPGAARLAPSQLVVAVEDKTAFVCLPLTIADRLGYFSVEGVALDIKEFFDQGAAMAAVQSGAAHVFSGAFASLLVQPAQGANLASLLVQGVAPQIVFGVSQRTMKGLQTARELRGRRIGVVALGSDSHRVARLVLNSGGLSEQDVRYLAMPNPASAQDAFLSGEIDALAYHDPLMTRLEQSGALRTLVDTRTVRGTQELFGGPLPSSCLAAKSAWLAAHPHLSQSTANAMVRALKWLRTAGPSDINKVVPEPYFQGDRALYLAAFERSRETWASDGVMPETGPMTVAKMLAKLGGKPPVSADSLLSTFTNQFALKAKGRFRAEAGAPHLAAWPSSRGNWPVALDSLQNQAG